MRSLTFVLSASLAASLAVTSLAGPEPIADSSKETPVIAQKEVVECKWYVEIGGGADFEFGDTQFNRGHSLNTFFREVTLDFDAHNFDDVYDTPYHIKGEVGYAVSDYVEFFGNFSYSAADGGSTSGGHFGFFSSDLSFKDEWGDYTSYGGQLGLRFFFLSRQSHFRPFISLAGGASHVDSIGLKMKATSDFGPFLAGDTIFDGSFYGDSTVATASILAGLEFNFTHCFAIGADAGATWQSKLSGDDGDLEKFDFLRFNLSGIHKLNDNAGDRLYCPVNFYAKFYF